MENIRAPSRPETPQARNFVTPTSTVIDLNVGGRHFSTELSTLTKYSSSHLADIMHARHNFPRDSEGRYFLDDNPDVFQHILEFLRSHQLPPESKAVSTYRAAMYYQLDELVGFLEQNSYAVMRLLLRTTIFPRYDAVRNIILDIIHNTLFRPDFCDAMLPIMIFFYTKKFDVDDLIRKVLENHQNHTSKQTKEIINLQAQFGIFPHHIKTFTLMMADDLQQRGYRVQKHQCAAVTVRVTFPITIPVHYLLVEM